MELRARIAEEIRRRGPIPFSRYMELCLYEPEFGYYSRAVEQFGKTGDFYTASDVHGVFGKLLARQFDEMWRALGAPARIAIIELGPGRGLFAEDVLEWSKKKFPDFLEALHYTLIERSPQLSLRLRDRFARYFGGQCPGPAPGMPARGETPGKISIDGSLDAMPQLPANVIVFANEFFDALPVEVIDSRGELRIALDGERLVESFAPPTPEALAFLDHYGVHPQENQRAEATLDGVDYMRRIAGLVPRGFVVAIDYGYTREELLAGRPGSTVRAFRRHAISDTPYEAPGEQDITANVNFTALREVGLAAGLDAGHILTQAQFLMGIGEPNQFEDIFEDAKLPQEHIKLSLQLKHLVSPAGMGEYFQVLLMHRGVDKDSVRQLSGMTFARK
jgi:SAM-dependent MidA family methyltransferase